MSGGFTVRRVHGARGWTPSVSRFSPTLLEARRRARSSGAASTQRPPPPWRSRRAPTRSRSRSSVGMLRSQPPSSSMGTCSTASSNDSLSAGRDVPRRSRRLFAPRSHRSPTELPAEILEHPGQDPHIAPIGFLSVLTRFSSFCGALDQTDPPRASASMPAIASASSRSRQSRNSTIRPARTVNTL